MNTLLLYLSGPMQSWGYRSRFDNRDTALEPTRSGIIGLLCAALGKPRTEDLEAFNSLRMGVRVDNPGTVLIDYHTAQNVIKSGTKNNENFNILSLLSGNKEEKNIEDVVSHRYFLSDARFLVGLESLDFDFLKQLETSLKNPRWFIFLGRKSFTPGLPICLPGKTIYPLSLEEALRQVPWHRLRANEEKPQSLRLVIETEFGKHERLQSDTPVNFARREFRLRGVKTDFIKADEFQEGGLLPCIFQD